MSLWKKVLLLVFTFLLITTIVGVVYYFFLRPKPIKVGLLHSQTGTMSLSELPVIDATLMAIEEINNEGGLLGCKIEPIIIDGKSEASIFAQQAEKLISDHNVEVIFGCWTSASRKAVKEVIEKHKHLLFYPVQYEGLEQSPNIVYTGAAPNQQILPAITWAFYNLGKKFFLIGSDYVFPHAANEIIKDHVKQLGGEIVDEMYIPLGSKDVDAVIKSILEKKPEIIINTINGDSNIVFFKQLRIGGVTPEKVPTISFSIAESELQALGTENLVGDYAAWNYFQSIGTLMNMDFVADFKKKYGKERVVNDPMEAGYFGVHIWARAVKLAATTARDKVHLALKDQGYLAPEGIVTIDEENYHTWKMARIGKILANGQFLIVWDSERPIRPVPYPLSRTQQVWDAFLQSLYVLWGNKWAKESL